MEPSRDTGFGEKYVEIVYVMKRIIYVRLSLDCVTPSRNSNPHLLRNF